jgi:hypothetical protein
VTWAVDRDHISVFVETLRFRFPSFDCYLEPIEQGAGSVGPEFVALSSDLRQIVREDVDIPPSDPTRSMETF